MTQLFLQLYESVMKNERGWNPNDQGSVTYNGINRQYAPGWKGWAVIDKRLPAKRGTIWADLETPAKEWYLQYWKDVGLNTDKLTDFKIAALFADMATQHGRWKQIVIAGLYGFDPMNTAYNRALTDTDYRAIASNPRAAYKKIADARLVYAKKVKLVNEGDRQGIINRAQKYVNDAIAYLKAVPVTGIVAALFFFI